MAARLAAGVVLTIPITGLFLLGPLALAAAAVRTRKQATRPDGGLPALSPLPVAGP
jgi:hypothetical protein